MTKKPASKFIALVTAVCTMAVMCGMPAVAFAWDGGVTKEETVYVVTDSSGAQTDVIVSDHLQNKGKSKTIADETTLTDIENVKGEETFKQKGEALTWEAEGNSIYYQGRTDAEVPVTMDVTYRLDNKVVSGPELQGKSGKVEIRIHYDNSAEYEGTTVPFVVMTGLIVTDDSFKNIKISKGKVIDDGEKLLVVGMAAPGLAQTLGIGESELGIGSTVIITGDAEEFAVEDMMTIVTNAFFEDIDSDSIDDLDYDDEIKQLDKGAKALVDGSDFLYQGLEELNDNMPDLQSGVQGLKDGADALEKGSADLYSGLGQVKSGIDQLAAGAKQFREEGMKGAADKLETAANLDTGASSDITDVIGDIEEIQDGLDEYIDSSEVSPAVRAKLSLLKGELGDMKTKLGGANTKVTNSGAIDSGVATSLTKEPTEANPDPTLYGEMLKLEGAIAFLSNKMGNATTPETVLNGGAQVAGGAKQLADGLTKLNNKSGTMVNGVYQLGDGAYKLRNGMSKLYKQGIKKIVDMYNNDLKGTLNDAQSMLDAGKGYKTFTKLPAGMDGNVKFIYKTDMTE